MLKHVELNSYILIFLIVCNFCLHYRKQAPSHQRRHGLNKQVLCWPDHHTDEMSGGETKAQTIYPGLMPVFKTSRAPKSWLIGFPDIRTTFY